MYIGSSSVTIRLHDCVPKKSLSLSTLWTLWTLWAIWTPSDPSDPFELFEPSEHPLNPTLHLVLIASPLETRRGWTGVRRCGRGEGWISSDVISDLGGMARLCRSMVLWGWILWLQPCHALFSFEFLGLVCGGLQALGGIPFVLTWNFTRNAFVIMSGDP